MSFKFNPFTGNFDIVETTSIGSALGATEGSVLFAGAGGILAQDNANFFWDDTANELKLNSMLKIGSDGTDSIITFDYLGGGGDLQVKNGGGDLVARFDDDGRMVVENLNIGFGSNAVEGMTFNMSSNDIIVTTVTGNGGTWQVGTTNENFITAYPQNITLGYHVPNADLSLILQGDSGTDGTITWDISADTFNFDNKVQINADNSTLNGLVVSNNTSSIISAATIGVQSDTASGYLYAFSSSYAFGGTHLADRIGLGSFTDAAGLSIFASSIGGDIEFYTDGSAAGDLKLTMSAEGFNFFPSDMTLTDSIDIWKIGSTQFNLDFASAGINFLRAAAIIELDQPAGASVQFIVADTTIRPNSSEDNDLSSWVMINDSAFLTDNGRTVTADEVITVLSSPFVSGMNTTEYVGLRSELRFATGTLTTSKAVDVTDPLGGGTITNNVGMYVADLVNGTNNYGIQSLMSAGANNLFINHTGTAESTFGGDVSVPDEAYGVGWNGSVEVPTKNAVYDKFESVATTFLPLAGGTMTGDIDFNADGTIDIGSDTVGIQRMYLGTDQSSAYALPDFRGLVINETGADFYVGNDNVFPGFYVQRSVLNGSVVNDNSEDYSNLYQGDSTYKWIAIDYGIEWNAIDSAGSNGLLIGDFTTNPPPLAFGSSGKFRFRYDGTNNKFRIYTSASGHGAVNVPILEIDLDHTSIQECVRPDTTDKIDLGDTANNLEWQAGYFAKDVRMRQMVADGDSAGTASTNTITGATDTPTATLDWSTVTAPNGYVKAYVGTQAVVIPYWNT